MGNERMIKTSEVKAIRQILAPAMGRYLLMTTALCTILLPLSLLRSVGTGWLPVYTLHIVLYCTMLLFTFVPKLVQFQLIFSITSFMIIGAAAILQFGASQVGEGAFVVAMVIATMGFGYLGFAIVVSITVVIFLTPNIVVMLEPIIGAGPKLWMMAPADSAFIMVALLFFGGSASYLAHRLAMAIHLDSQRLFSDGKEKDKRADELILANDEKDKRADELILANDEKDKRADQLAFANKELAMSFAYNARLANDLTQLIDTANAPIFGIDTEGKVNEWNQQSEKITGYKKEEVMGRDLVADFITDDFKHSVGIVLAQALNGDETNNFEFPLYSKTGDRVDVLLNSTTRRDAAGKVIGVVGVGQDITELNDLRLEQERERKVAAAQIIQASKLATLGEMSTSVAHELNQPLNVIRMAAGNSRRKIANGTADPEYLNDKLERIEDQTARAAAIIDHMRMFGREATEHP
ncbi:MAG: PAS domain S-box-containing protein, partial [Halieaceae bacterium]